MAESFRVFPLAMSFALAIGLWLGAAFSLIFEPALPLIVGLAVSLIIWIAGATAGDD